MIPEKKHKSNKVRVSPNKKNRQNMANTNYSSLDGKFI